MQLKTFRSLELWWKCETEKQCGDSVGRDRLRITYDGPSGMCSFTCICDSDTTYLVFDFVLTHEDDLFLYLKLQNEPCVNVETK